MGAKWSKFMENGAAAREQQLANKEARDDKRLAAKRRHPAGKKISEVGDLTQAGLACPKCGGTQFKPKRSGLAKTVGIATVGVGAALAPKNEVRCLTCKTDYKRG